MPWNYDLCAEKRVLRLPLNRLTGSTVQVVLPVKRDFSIAF